MTEPVLLQETTNGIVTLTLNRPEARNALSYELHQALTDAFGAAQADPGVRVVILTGSGAAFCAGLDLKELAANPRKRGANVVRAMETFDRPIIGAINGPAVTGGFEVALACDILIASPAGSFADTHARVGILPGWGLSQRLQRAVGAYRAKELAFTGNYLDAERACEWGLVNRVVPADSLLDTAHELARDILSCLPEAVRTQKHLIETGMNLHLDEALAYERKISSESIRAIAKDQLANRVDGIQERGRKQRSAIREG